MSFVKKKMKEYSLNEGDEESNPEMESNLLSTIYIPKNLG